MEDSHLPDAKDWLDEDKRKAFVDSTVDRVKSHNLGGVFFDYEGQLYGGVRDAYSKLARETANALVALNATIVVCVGASPSYMRHFDYGALADASEFLFIMGYDMHFWDDYTCVTKGTCSPAEAPMRSLEKDVADYLKLVPAKKLTLGLPWYGQRYKYILGVPFNYGQIDYKDVLKAFDEKRVTKKTFEEDDQSWKIDCKHDCMHDNTGNVVWFDDVKTLTPKYALARSQDLRGIGMWSASKLDYSGAHTQEVTEMWSAISNW